MANDLLPIPEGAIEIPVSIPEGAGLLPVPEGAVEVTPSVPSATSLFKEGVVQGVTERAAGAGQLMSEAESVGRFITGLPTGELRSQMEQEYKSLLQEQGAYEEAGRVLPATLQAMRGVGRFAGSAVYDIPLMALTGGRSATGRLATGMGAGAISGATVPAANEEERVRNAALGAAFGGAGTSVFEAARLNANLVDRQLRKALDIPEIAKRYDESETLSNMTGIDFSLGQATGSRALQAYESMAANSLRSENTVFAARSKQLHQSIQYLNGVMGRLGDPTVSPEVVGKELKAGMLKAVDDIVELRSSSWDDFMNKAVISSGNRPIGVPSKTVVKLDEIIDEMRHPNSGYSPALIKRFEALRKNASTPWSVKDFQTTMKTWGRNAAGTSQPFEALNIADQKRIFREVMSSMRDDLDSIATQGGVQGDAAKNLNMARESWKNYSTQIDELETTVLGDAIDKGGKPLSGEELYAKVRRMPASDLKRIVPLMDSIDTKIMNNVKVRIFKDAFAEAEKGAGIATALPQFSPIEFYRKISSVPNAEVIFSNPAEMKEYMTAVAAMKRIASWAGEGAAQSPAQMQSKAGALIGGGAEAGGLPNLVFLSKFLVENITPDRYAKLLMTPEGRNAVISLSKPQRIGRKALNTSVGTIVGVLTSPNSVEQAERRQEQLTEQVRVE